MKEQANMKNIFKNLPSEVFSFYKYICELSYSEKPNYQVAILSIFDFSY